MRRRLLLFALTASVLPAFALAQEPKLVNCRTLEAAGNFVGPDEVIVDDMVCQKAKPGADSAAKPQAPKPVLGATISDTPAESVVEAARAAEKRVASRKEKEAAEAQEIAAAAAPTNPPPASEPPSEPPAPTPVPARDPESGAVPPAKPTPVAVTPTNTPAPSSSAHPPTEKPEVVAHPAPEPAAPTASAPARESEHSAPAEIVISSAPASVPAATSPAAERRTEPPAEVVAAPAPVPTPSAPEPAAPPPRPTEALPPADPTHPATSSGFYDANAAKTSANAAPQTNSGFATAEQVNAGLKPGASAIPPASQPPAPESAAPEPEPQHTTIAAARVPFDEDRDRSVKVGDFAKPKDVSPDPAAEHRTSVDPSDADGFQDRQRPECTKNITLGGLKGERLVLGVPTWAVKWIEKNEKRMPEICFSETPMKTARNYLIVFSTPGGTAGSKDINDAVLNPTNGSSATGVGTFTTNFGSTWHYSYDRNVGTTVLTTDDADEPHGQPGQVLYATAYTEEGVPVSQRWPGQVKKELKPGEKRPKKLKGETEALERVSSDLLSQMVEDIEKF